MLAILASSAIIYLLLCGYHCAISANILGLPTRAIFSSLNVQTKHIQTQLFTPILTHIRSYLSVSLHYLNFNHLIIYLNMVRITHKHFYIEQILTLAKLLASMGQKFRRVFFKISSLTRKFFDSCDFLTKKNVSYDSLRLNFAQILLMIRSTILRCKEFYTVL